jgi:hypothetical protein
MLIGLVAAGAAVFGVPGVASADPDPAPPPPPPPLNLNALTPVKPADFSIQSDQGYGFAVPGDVACIISRASGNYGCSGPIPAALDGANRVTGGQQGTPTFSTAGPLYDFQTLPNRLPAGSRISFRNVTCGTDGRVTQCTNSFDGAGFVISPAGSFVLEPNNPLLLNTGEGKNPYSN